MGEGGEHPVRASVAIVVVPAAEREGRGDVGAGGVGIFYVHCSDRLRARDADGIAGARGCN